MLQNDFKDARKYQISVDDGEANCGDRNQCKFLVVYAEFHFGNIFYLNSFATGALSTNMKQLRISLLITEYFSTT